VAGVFNSGFSQLTMPAEVDALPQRERAVAIIGLGCRLPGADTPDEFWHLLSTGSDAVREAAPDRPHYTQPGEFGRLITRRGGFVANLQDFDPYFFGISPRDAVGLDPQHRFLLEAAWRAAEDAGVTLGQLQGLRTGVFVGLCADDYRQILWDEMPDAEFQILFSNLRSNGSGRLSYALGLTGPSMAVDTACSSSLVSVHLAVRSLQAGDCELAFAGGANTILDLQGTRSFMRGGLLSPDGKCQAFSEHANGFVRSEGAGVALLKPLRRALADGDRIYAVILGSAVNSDGGTAAFLTPSREGQAAVIRAACAEANISPAEVVYVEAHGTGTPTGDPIEVSALVDVLGDGRPLDSPLRIGSCKTNIGHLEGGAGIAGLMKAALSIHHRRIPPSLHADELSSKIPWSEIPVSVQRTLDPWPQGKPLLAGVSSFGIYGANAHILLGHAGSSRTASAPEGRRIHVLPISARDEVSLRELAAEWQRHLRESPASTADLCRTAALRRTHFDHRLTVCRETREALADGLAGWLAGEASAGVVSGRATLESDGQPVFVFSGVGSHWPGMASELYDRYPVFRDSLDRTGAALVPYCQWKIVEELRRDEASSRLDRLDIGQPALFAVQVALSDLWRSWGVEPGAVIGHSLGEIAAAFVAGAITLSDAVRIVIARSELMTATHGGMLACGVSPAEGEALIRGVEDRVAVGVVSGSRSIVLSGDSEALDEIARTFDNTAIFVRRVKTRAPTHSPLVDPILEEFGRRITPLEPQPSRIPLYSTVTGARIDGAQLTPEYWQRNLRGRVNFAAAMERMLADGQRLFIEISPHPLLTAPMETCAVEHSCHCTVVPSVRRGQDSELNMLESFCRLHAAGYPVPWTAHHGADSTYVAVPGHPFRRERLWLTNGNSGRHAEQTFARASRPGSHPLLPLRFDLADKPGVHVWEGTLDPADHPFLVQHFAQEHPVLPATVYYELAYAIAGEILGPGPRTFSNVRLRRALFLPDGGTVRLQAVLAPSRVNSFSLRFFASTRHGSHADAADWQLMSEMTFQAGDCALRPPVARPPIDGDAKHVSGADFYTSTSGFGLRYGPQYQGIKEAWQHDSEITAELEMPEPLKREVGFSLHPAFLDAVVQVPLLNMTRTAAGLLPVSVDEIYIARALKPGERFRVHCRTYETMQFDATLMTEEGTVLFQVRRVTCRELAASDQGSAQDVEWDWIYQKRWEPSELPEVPALAPGRWVILGDADDAAALGRHLERHGQSWHTRPRGEDLDASPLESSDPAPNVPWKGLVYLALDHSTDERPPTEQKDLCGAFLRLIQSIAGDPAAKAIRVFVATRRAHVVEPGESSEVQLGPLLGLARAAGNEFPRLQVTLVDLPDVSGFDGLIAEMLANSPELEVAYRHGKRHVARIGRLPLDRVGRRRKRVRLDARQDASYRVASPNPGSLDRVALEVAARRVPAAGEIEVRVAAGGLNFLDVLRSLNMGPGQTPGPVYFGMEFAGVVSRVGADVREFRVGDRVVALASPGEACFQAWVTIPARYALPVPSHFTLEEAAGCLVAYQTAWYALVEQGRMRAGERVLIHAAAGGVGLAAVHVSKHLGAEIFVTAGSPEKRDYLRGLGIQHVMDSRTLEFADHVLSLTENRGVDLVLNSISGEAIPKSISTLAAGGRFLEIGKRDIYANSALDLYPFRNNLSFYAVDMLGLTATREELVLRVTREVWERLVHRDLPPLNATAFPASRAADAFRYMAQSRQIGKVIVTFAEPEVDAEIPEEQLVRPDGTYLVTGGLTGLGLECAKWLASQGAKHFVLAGRRAPSPIDAQRIAELSEGGRQVVTAIEDVSEPAGVRRMIAAIDTNMPPLVGVIHSAGMARDGILERLTWGKFEEVFAPKVHGSWNLHAELIDRDLDFFVMFSSVASWLGSAGQANYAAANAFLDSLGEYRESRGLPCLTINWGPWTRIGMLENHKLQPAPIFGEHGIRPEQGIACLKALLARNVARATVMSADWKVWGETMPASAARPLFADFRKTMTVAPSVGDMPADGIRGDLAGLSKTDAVALIRQRLGREVVAVLRISGDRLDVHVGLQRLGLDSLMAVELSNRIQETIGLNVPVMTLLKGPSLDELATELYTQIEPSIPSRKTETGETVAAAAEASGPLMLVRSAPKPRPRPGSWVIQEGESRRTLFCLGGVHPWPIVGKRLGSDYRLVGIIPKDVDCEGRPEMEHFAASVAKEIREHQPTGPYHLTGWSVWGIVAFETARQMMAASQAVESVTVVDGYLPPASLKFGKTQQLVTWARMEGQRLAYHVRRLRQERAFPSKEYVRERMANLVRYRLRPILQASIKKQAPKDGIASAETLAQLLLSANATYRAKPYPGRIVLCVAQDRHDDVLGDHSAIWKTVALGQVEIVTLRGDHESIFDSENISPLIEKLRDVLTADRTPLETYM
jgi:acyl transferase domain-containing protein/thioesterase domain-containing protein